MWELDHKGGWSPKNWCFWAVVLEKALESPLDWKEIQPVHSKGDQSWVFFGKNDAKAETPVLWPPHAKSWLIGKDCDAGRDWGKEEKGTTEDEMARWHHWLDGCESEWTLGVGDGRRGLACCNSCGHKESDMTEWLNWTDDRHDSYPHGAYSLGKGAHALLFNNHNECDNWKIAVYFVVHCVVGYLICSVKCHLNRNLKEECGLFRWRAEIMVLQMIACAKALSLMQSEEGMGNGIYFIWGCGHKSASTGLVCHVENFVVFLLRTTGNFERCKNF